MDISDQCRPGVGYTYGAQTWIWYIHGITCDNQRYPWYISKHWYIPGISLVYAKTRKLINRVKIPDAHASTSNLCITDPGLPICTLIFTWKAPATSNQRVQPGANAEGGNDYTQ